MGRLAPVPPRGRAGYPPANRRAAFAPVRASQGDAKQRGAPRGRAIRLRTGEPHSLPARASRRSRETAGRTPRAGHPPANRRAASAPVRATARGPIGIPIPSARRGARQTADCIRQRRSLWTFSPMTRWYLIWTARSLTRRRASSPRSGGPWTRWGWRCRRTRTCARWWGRRWRIPSGTCWACPRRACPRPWSATAAISARGACTSTACIPTSAAFSRCCARPGCMWGWPRPSRCGWPGTFWPTSRSKAILTAWWARRTRRPSWASPS